jgi:hypothetical protein
VRREESIVRKSVIFGIAAICGGLYAVRIEYSDLMLRIPPEVRTHAAMMVEAHGKSLNQWAADVLMYAS